MGEVCCHRNPCRWQSWLLDTCTRDHKKKKKKGQWVLGPRKEHGQSWLAKPSLHTRAGSLTSAHQHLQHVLKHMKMERGVHGLPARTGTGQGIKGALLLFQGPAAEPCSCSAWCSGSCWCSWHGAGLAVPGQECRNPPTRLTPRDIFTQINQAAPCPFP